MSAWGITNFENDVALDFVAEIAASEDHLNLTQDIDDFLNEFNVEETSLDDCLEFLAKMELLAALLGAPSEDFPLELKDWIERKYIKIDSSVCPKAVKAVQMIVNDSEAKEMYLDSGYFNAWLRTQKELIKRLKA